MQQSTHPGKTKIQSTNPDQATQKAFLHAPRNIYYMFFKVAGPSTPRPGFEMYTSQPRSGLHFYESNPISGNYSAINLKKSLSFKFESVFRNPASCQRTSVFPAGNRVLKIPAPDKKKRGRKKKIYLLPDLHP
ncbi:MAG: hypothetical protein PHW56_00325 [Methanosarcinaceae archaeon]|nr:hypothetical protein [Methanosarcinaceae archaeon]